MALTPWPYPLWIAHRGAGKLAPENTLAAFREGARLGYRGFECDVKLSADDVPFLLHDDTLERTTGAGGPAGALPWAALSRLDAGGWHSRAYAGEPLASLDAVAAFCVASGLALNLELKPSPGRAHDTGRVVARHAVHLWAQAALPPLLSSFNVQALEGARDAAPGLPRALLLDALSDGWLARAQALGCIAVVARHDLLDAGMVGQSHAAGLQALAYTVNDAQTAQRLLGLGVAGLITDALERFAPAIPPQLR